MSDYYNPKRTRSLFDPNASEPFKISRSKLDLFLNCPRCFYLDRRIGISRPPGYPFSLNSAVDTLLKKEFDQYRAKGEAHPLMKAHKVDAIPFSHEKLEEWRDALRRGITHHHNKSNLIITGGIDDLWITSGGEVIIVDYKATSKSAAVTLDADWQIGYKRQMEVYSWLFKQNGFKVHPIAYFVYCNGKTDRESFDAKLEFEISVLPYSINDRWVEDIVIAARECLDSDSIPEHTDTCDHCRYVLELKKLECVE